MTQLHLKRAPSKGSAFRMLGIPGHEAQISLQSDAYKELVNKLAWALGSAYNMPYNNILTQARASANELAAAVVNSHGYPKKIGYPK